MHAEKLPSEFDVVILGTGLAESIVAAACARVGQRVLHLDGRSYYGGNWASFTFNNLLAWIQKQNNGGQISEAVRDWSGLIEEGEEAFCLSSTDSAPISNVQVFCYTSEEDEEVTRETPSVSNTNDGCTADATDPGTGNTHKPTSERPTEQLTETEQKGPEGTQSPPSRVEKQSELTGKMTYAWLLKEGRRFNIDLVSKLMYSRGPLVNLLIKSNISRYAEFKNVTRILTCVNGRVEKVPCSRADVFASKRLGVVEKRVLMKFLRFCLDYQDRRHEYQAFAKRPFAEFLQAQKLMNSLRHLLLHSISMAKEDTSTEEGLASTRHFLQCLGRYGNTPFLFPLYGLGEIPQGFCRMSAVFGGIYCLGHSIQSLVIGKDKRCKAVIDSRGQRIGCSHVVLEEGHVEEGLKSMATPAGAISRAILITDSSVLPSDSEQVSFVSVPPVEPGSPAVRLVELCPSTMTCIPGTYLVHLTCPSVSSAYQDLFPVVSRMFRTPESRAQGVRPSVLWCVYFNMVDSSAAVEEESYNSLPPNVHVCSGPDASLGHRQPVALAESIFRKILPGEEFCPGAPNPEDEDEEEQNEGDEEREEERLQVEV